MFLSKEKKESIIKKFQKSSNDVGSAQVQIALFTEKIKILTEHFKLHKKDFHSMQGLKRMVELRKKLSSYLKKQDPKDYQKVVSELGLRK